MINETLAGFVHDTECEKGGSSLSVAALMAVVMLSFLMKKAGTSGYLPGW